MFSSWMKTLAIYILLVNVLEHMIPKDSYKKYINFFCGIVMVTILIEPLKLFLNHKINYDEHFFDYYERTLEKYTLGDSYNNFSNDSIEQAIINCLVEENIVSGDKIKCVEVFSYENKYLASCKVYIDGEVDESKVKSTISYFYNINDSNIYILRW